MNRKLAVVSAACMVALAAGCSTDDGNAEQPGLAAVEQAQTEPAEFVDEDPAADDPTEDPDVLEFLARDDERDLMDCEADDKAKKELPDCGFYAGPDNKTFYWWSWVKAGRITPPKGWSASNEVASYRPASPAARPGAAPAPTNAKARAGSTSTRPTSTRRAS